ncbi:hypothetical protein CK203_051942 [Vitis vinifera]|uniref:Uncharacterized protein n=1 Tax=Vitis vinifera TaxID=29760 RepID=A0A438GTJ9_VITVI|nr:hypothetical protein CK203_051942 [Vitis vinifera]
MAQPLGLRLRGKGVGSGIGMVLDIFYMLSVSDRHIHKCLLYSIQTETEMASIARNQDVRIKKALLDIKSCLFTGVKAVLKSRKIFQNFLVLTSWVNRPKVKEYYRQQ